MENIIKGPFANTAAATLIRQKIDEMKPDKTQKQIALEVGYDKPNMIAMIKHGNSKLPFEKVLAFAKALEIDPAYLLRLVFKQNSPECHDSFAKIGIQILSEEEMAAVNQIRSSKVTVS